MDYDQTQMPESYDLGRKPPDGVLEMWTNRIAASLAGHGVHRIVDLGCGTGRFSTLLARQFDAEVLAVDPSEKMLAVARAKPTPDRVAFVKGSGEAIPCGDATIDLVFMSMVFHHIPSPRRMLDECARVLRDGGFVCIRNSTRDHAWPYEAYFPNYRAALAGIPSAAGIEDAFVDTPFRPFIHEIVPHTMASSLGELAEKAAHRADTTLLRLSDADFEQGLAAMRAAAIDDQAPVTADIDLFIFRREPRSN